VSLSAKLPNPRCQIRAAKSALPNPRRQIRAAMTIGSCLSASFALLSLTEHGRSPTRPKLLLDPLTRAEQSKANG
jgi:hypothetical protein